MFYFVIIITRYLDFNAYVFFFFAVISDLFSRNMEKLTRFGVYDKLTSRTRFFSVRPCSRLFFFRTCLAGRRRKANDTDRKELRIFQ